LAKAHSGALIGYPILRMIRNIDMYWFISCVSLFLNITETIELAKQNATLHAQVLTQ